MAREPIPTYFFVLVVVRRGNEFLLVQERKHGQGWYLPAGRVELGEDLTAAAVREALEESGVQVQLTGLLRIEHSTAVGHRACRVRVIFTGAAPEDALPKQHADEHSLQARWVTIDETRRLPLRGQEVLQLLEHVASGAPVYPLSVLAREDAPWV